MDSLRKVFGYRLKEIRGNETQDDFAERLKIPSRTYQKWEAGVVPQKAKLKKLVEKLGLPSETPLFADPDYVPRPPSVQMLSDKVDALAAENERLKRELAALKSRPTAEVIDHPETENVIRDLFADIRRLPPDMLDAVRMTVDNRMEAAEEEAKKTTSSSEKANS